MTEVCLKCGYLRQAGDNAPEYECPKCGVVYAKAKVASSHEGQTTGVEQAEESGTNESALHANGNHDKSSNGTEKSDHDPLEQDIYFASVDDAPIPPLSINLGIAGSFILFLGVFAPILHVPVIGELNYFRNGEGDGVIVMAMALLSLFFVIRREPSKLLWTASIALATLIFTFLYFQYKFYQFKDGLATELKGNPFAGLARIALEKIQIEWGWGVLLFGTALLYASVLSFKRQAYTIADLTKNVSGSVGTAGQRHFVADATMKLADRPEPSATSSDVSAKVDLAVVTARLLRTLNQYKLVVLATVLVTIAIGAFFTAFQPKRITGQAFIVTEGRVNIRLGAMRVDAYKKADFENAFQEFKATAEEKDVQFDLWLENTEKLGLENHMAAIKEQLAFYAAKSEYPSLDGVVKVATTETDADGNFSLDLPPGNYVIVAKARRKLMGESENYEWMFYINQENFKKPILISNSNLLERGHVCEYCVKPIEFSRVANLKVTLANLELQLSAQRQKEELQRREAAAAQAAKEKAFQMQVEAAERQARLEMLDANRREIDQLSASIPEFDSVYRAPAGCQVDNPSMTQLLACGRARADAQRAHDQRYSAARIRLKELKAQQREYESAVARPNWSRY